MKILLGMSGGLDSTYAACLLREAGHEVVGCALRMHEHTPLADAYTAAEQVGIPLTILDAEPLFREQVISPFLQAYASGRTPNPCVLCNPSVKIEVLCRHARENGFDRVATGHYSFVLCDPETERFFIRMATEPKKDQSYALCRLTQDQLSLLTFPLAGARKQEIRADAERRGLRAAHSAESMENCFIPAGHYVDFLKSHGILPTEGAFVDADGKRIGTHSGICHYTIGQRKGLGLSLGYPAFVCAIDPIANTVRIGRESELYTETASISSLVFQKLPPLGQTISARVKIRYSAPPQAATVRISPDLTRAEITFSSPARAITPGQSAVIYDGDDLLMSGIFL